MTQIHIKLANPRGFCAGVDRAIEIVERALEQFGAPIYVRHEVVHNKFVVDSLRTKGAVFVEELDEVPDQSTVIFSAHGVSKAVRSEADRRKLTVFDATCPLVTKVHIEVVRNSKNGRDTILIGHKGHPEVEGTMGQYTGEHGGKIFLVESPEDVDKITVDYPDNISYVTQTTLSVDDTKEIIEKLKIDRGCKLRVTVEVEKGISKDRILSYAGLLSDLTGEERKRFDGTVKRRSLFGNRKAEI